MAYSVKNKEDFDKQLQDAGSKLVVVDFYATWCGPCKMISPHLEQLAKEHGSKVVVLKVDVDECEDLACEYSISSMPTFIFFKNGEKIETLIGANLDNLKKKFIENI